jgi:branched-chain amino acid transport system substrate-binding protein
MRRWIWLGVWAATACGASDDMAGRRAARAERAHGDILVATPWPWSAHQDTHYGDGLQLAADEINESGGVKGRHIRLVRYDDHESVDEGRAVAEQIAANPDVVAVIGHLQSYVTMPALAMYDVAGLVVIAPTATDPALTQQGYRQFFRATFSDPAVGARMADFAAARHYQRVAISYIRDTYGRDLANAFEERAAQRGVQVVARDSYDPGADVTAQELAGTLREWKGLTPDAVFLAGEVPSAATIVSEARRAGFTQPILGGDAMSSPALIEVAGKAAEGVIVAAAFHPDEPRPAARQFTDAFTKRFGTPPDVGAALGYDALMVLADGMRHAGTTVPAEVARALHSTTWEGATGPFSFDSAGNRVSTPIVTTVVRGGRFVWLADTTETRIAAR